MAPVGSMISTVALLAGLATFVSGAAAQHDMLTSIAEPAFGNYTGEYGTRLVTLDESMVGQHDDTSSDSSSDDETPYELERAGSVYSFDDITPKDKLEWVPCFGDFTCANVKVPLDYEDNEAGWTNLPLIKLDAPQPAVGDILYNPGGPGVSGVAIVACNPKAFQIHLGTGYNIIGFDPRGTGNNDIFLNCSYNRPTIHGRSEKPVFNLTDADSRSLLSDAFDEAGKMGEQCTEDLKKTEAKFANTVAVAHDMLRFIELRSEEKKEPKGTGLLNFYGASYGTVLGITFASLFPDRVGRFVLDSVVDAEAYYHGWSNSTLLEADAAIRSFPERCHALRKACQFDKNAQSVEEVKARFDATLKNIEQHRTLEVFDPFNPSKTQINVTTIQTALLFFARDTAGQFHDLDELMTELENANSSSYLQWYDMSGGASLEGCLHLRDIDEKRDDGWSRVVISCNDANGRYNISTFDQWENHVKALVNQSAYIGEFWAPIWSLPCRNLHVSPPESQIFYGLNITQTKTPILFLQAKYDPVTPAAERMSRFFNGSVVLTQDSARHVIQNSEFRCTGNAIQAYYNDLKMPAPGKVCMLEPSSIFTDHLSIKTLLQSDFDRIWL